MSVESPESSRDEDALKLTSLDSESLFTALTAVEKSIPDLLSCVKPILKHLTSSQPGVPGQDQAGQAERAGKGGDEMGGIGGAGVEGGDEDEAAGLAARDAVERYMTLLDKIQFVLRQTVYYLHETKASSSTLRPPLPHAIPTPFASSMPDPDSTSASTSGGSQAPGASSAGATGGSGSDSSSTGGAACAAADVQLGLYASRLEARTLEEMAQVLRNFKQQVGEPDDVNERTDGVRNVGANGDGYTILADESL